MGRPVLAALVLACAFWGSGCSGSDLDTSWHVEYKPLPEKHHSKGRIETGEHAWRFVRFAQPGETLPGGLKAGPEDVVWEWRLELTNLLDEPIQVKAGFGLVTADAGLAIARSQYPAEEKELATLQPREKKVFTGRGLIGKKDISRIAKGRGMLGTLSGPGAQPGNTRKGER
jgi:hypothetical protein